MIHFEVLGVPAPQGSMKAFAVNGRAMMKPSGGNKFAQWRNAVSQAARDLNVEAPLDGPLMVTLTFRFPMPASRSKAIREVGTVHKTTAPDIDKLARAIFDALTAAAVITDDARIVDVQATKVETTGWTGVAIEIARIGRYV